MDQYPLFAVLASAYCYRISCFDSSRLDDVEFVTTQDNHPVHAPFPCQKPAAVGQSDIFRVIGGGVKTVGEDAVGRGRFKTGRRGGGKVGPLEVGGSIGRDEGHDASPFSDVFCC
jgi:hypothetical protein